MFMNEDEYYAMVDSFEKAALEKAEAGEEFPTMTPEDIAQYAIWEYEDSYRDMLWMDEGGLK